MVVAPAIILAVAIGAIVTGIVLSKAASVDIGKDGIPKSVYSAYGVYPIHSQSLFDSNGNVRANVMAALNEQLAEIKASNTPNNKDTWIETTNKHFSARAQSLTHKASGALVIKLFETVDSSDKNIVELSKGWYQLVYRAKDAGEEGARDVLTLWAIEPYRTSVFGGSTNKYSDSTLRSAVLSDYTELIKKYPKVNNYFATTDGLPGNWQSSAYQTGKNEAGDYYSSASDGASGSGQVGIYINTWSLFNGMDGLNQDKIWIPSAFETSYMGQGKESNGFASYLADKNNSKSGLRRYTTPNTALNNQDAAIRHGLWQLNGYDRAFSGKNDAWLRSGSSVTSVSGHSLARRLTTAGDTYNIEIDAALAARPAFNLLLQDVQKFADSAEKLGNLISSAKQLKQSYYNSGKYSSLKDTEIPSAETILKNGIFSSMDTAYTNLNDAINGLEPNTAGIVAKDGILQSIVTKAAAAAALKQEEYTKHSWQRLTAAVNYAKTLNGTASLQQLELELAMMNVLMDDEFGRLEKVAAQPTGKGNDDGVNLMVLGIIVGAVTIIIGLPTIFIVRKPREGKVVKVNTSTPVDEGTTM